MDRAAYAVADLGERHDAAIPACTSRLVHR